MAEVRSARGSSLDPLALAEAVRRAGFTPRELGFDATGRLLRQEGKLLLLVGEKERLSLDPHVLPAGETPASGAAFRVRATWRGEAPRGAGSPATILELEEVSRN